jgi:hypothetical protein
MDLFACGDSCRSAVALNCASSRTAASSGSSKGMARLQSSFQMQFCLDVGRKLGDALIARKEKNAA